MSSDTTDISSMQSTSEKEKIAAGANVFVDNATEVGVSLGGKVGSFLRGLLNAVTLGQLVGEGSEGETISALVKTGVLVEGISTLGSILSYGSSALLGNFGGQQLIASGLISGIVSGLISLSTILGSMAVGLGSGLIVLGLGAYLINQISGDSKDTPEGESESDIASSSAEAESKENKIESKLSELRSDKGQGSSLISAISESEDGETIQLDDLLSDLGMGEVEASDSAQSMSFKRKVGAIREAVKDSVLGGALGDIMELKGEKTLVRKIVDSETGEIFLITATKDGFNTRIDVVGLRSSKGAQGEIDEISGSASVKTMVKGLLGAGVGEADEDSDSLVSNLLSDTLDGRNSFARKVKVSQVSGGVNISSELSMELDSSGLVTSLSAGNIKVNIENTEEKESEVDAIVNAAGVLGDDIRIDSGIGLSELVDYATLSALRSSGTIFESIDLSMGSLDMTISELTEGSDSLLVEMTKENDMKLSINVDDNETLDASLNDIDATVDKLLSSALSDLSEIKEALSPLVGNDNIEISASAIMRDSSVTLSNAITSDMDKEEEKKILSMRSPWSTVSFVNREKDNVYDIVFNAENEVVGRQLYSSDESSDLGFSLAKDLESKVQSNETLDYNMADYAEFIVAQENKAATETGAQTEGEVEKIGTSEDAEVRQDTQSKVLSKEEEIKQTVEEPSSDEKSVTSKVDFVREVGNVLEGVIAEGGETFTGDVNLDIEGESSPIIVRFEAGEITAIVIEEAEGELSLSISAGEGQSLSKEDIAVAVFTIKEKLSGKLDVGESVSLVLDEDGSMIFNVEAVEGEKAELAVSADEKTTSLPLIEKREFVELKKQESSAASVLSRELTGDEKTTSLPLEEKKGFVELRSKESNVESVLLSKVTEDTKIDSLEEELDSKIEAKGEGEVLSNKEDSLAVDLGQEKTLQTSVLTKEEQEILAKAEQLEAKDKAQYKKGMAEASKRENIGEWFDIGGGEQIRQFAENTFESRFVGASVSHGWHTGKGATRDEAVIKMTASKLKQKVWSAETEKAAKKTTEVAIARRKAQEKLKPLEVAAAKERTALSNAIGEVQTKIAKLRTKMQDESRPSEVAAAKERTALSSEIGEIKTEIAKLRTKMQDELRSTEVSAAKEQTASSLEIDKIETEIAQLKTKMQDELRSTEVSDAKKKTAFSLEMDKVNTEIAQLKTKMQEELKPFEVSAAREKVSISEQISEIKTEIAKLRQVDTETESQEKEVETKISGLESKIKMLGEQPLIATERLEAADVEISEKYEPQIEALQSEVKSMLREELSSSDVVEAKGKEIASKYQSLVSELEAKLDAAYQTEIPAVAEVKAKRKEIAAKYESLIAELEEKMEVTLGKELPKASDADATANEITAKYESLNKSLELEIEALLRTETPAADRLEKARAEVWGEVDAQTSPVGEAGADVSSGDTSSGVITPAAQEAVATSAQAETPAQAENPLRVESASVSELVAKAGVLASAPIGEANKAGVVSEIGGVQVTAKVNEAGKVLVTATNNKGVSFTFVVTEGREQAVANAVEVIGKTGAITSGDDFNGVISNIFGKAGEVDIQSATVEIAGVKYEIKNTGTVENSLTTLTATIEIPEGNITLDFDITSGSGNVLSYNTFGALSSAGNAISTISQAISSVSGIGVGKDISAAVGLTGSSASLLQSALPGGGLANSILSSGLGSSFMSSTVTLAGANGVSLSVVQKFETSELITAEGKTVETKLSEVRLQVSLEGRMIMNEALANMENGQLVTAKVSPETITRITGALYAGGGSEASTSLRAITKSVVLLMGGSVAEGMMSGIVNEIRQIFMAADVGIENIEKMLSSGQISIAGDLGRFMISPKGEEEHGFNDITIKATKVELAKKIAGLTELGSQKLITADVSDKSITINGKADYNISGSFSGKDLGEGIVETTQSVDLSDKKGNIVGQIAIGSKIDTKSGLITSGAIVNALNIDVESNTVGGGSAGSSSVKGIEPAGKLIVGYNNEKECITLSGTIIIRDGNFTVGSNQTVLFDKSLRSEAKDGFTFSIQGQTIQVSKGYNDVMGHSYAVIEAVDGLSHTSIDAVRMKNGSLQLGKSRGSFSKTLSDGKNLAVVNVMEWSGGWMGIVNAGVTAEIKSGSLSYTDAATGRTVMVNEDITVDVGKGNSLSFSQTLSDGSMLLGSTSSDGKLAVGNYDIALKVNESGAQGAIYSLISGTEGLSQVKGELQIQKGDIKLSSQFDGSNLSSAKTLLQTLMGANIGNISSLAALETLMSDLSVNAGISLSGGDNFSVAIQNTKTMDMIGIGVIGVIQIGNASIKTISIQISDKEMVTLDNGKWVSSGQVKIDAAKGAITVNASGKVLGEIRGNLLGALGNIAYNTIKGKELTTFIEEKNVLNGAALAELRQVFNVTSSSGSIFLQVANYQHNIVAGGDWQDTSFPKVGENVIAMNTSTNKMVGVENMKDGKIPPIAAQIISGITGIGLANLGKFGFTDNAGNNIAAGNVTLGVVCEKLGVNVSDILTSGDVNIFKSGIEKINTILNAENLLSTWGKELTNLSAPLKASGIKISLGGALQTLQGDTGIEGFTNAGFGEYDVINAFRSLDMGKLNDMVGKANTLLAFDSLIGQNVADNKLNNLGTTVGKALGVTQQDIYNIGYNNNIDSMNLFLAKNDALSFFNSSLGVTLKMGGGIKVDTALGMSKSAMIEKIAGAKTQDNITSFKSAVGGVIAMDKAYGENIKLDTTEDGKVRLTVASGISRFAGDTNFRANTVGGKTLKLNSEVSLIFDSKTMGFTLGNNVQWGDTGKGLVLLAGAQINIANEGSFNIIQGSMEIFRGAKAALSGATMVKTLEGTQQGETTPSSEKAQIAEITRDAEQFYISAGTVKAGDMDLSKYGAKGSIRTEMDNAPESIVLSISNNQFVATEGLLINFNISDSKAFSFNLAGTQISANGTFVMSKIDQSDSNPNNLQVLSFDTWAKIVIGKAVKLNNAGGSTGATGIYFSKLLGQLAAGNVNGTETSLKIMTWIPQTNNVTLKAGKVIDGVDQMAVIKAAAKEMGITDGIDLLSNANESSNGALARYIVTGEGGAKLGTLVEAVNTADRVQSLVAQYGIGKYAEIVSPVIQEIMSNTGVEFGKAGTFDSLIKAMTSGDSAAENRTFIAGKADQLSNNIKDTIASSFLGQIEQEVKSFSAKQEFIGMKGTGEALLKMGAGLVGRAVLGVGESNC